MVCQIADCRIPNKQGRNRLWQKLASPKIEIQGWKTNLGYCECRRTGYAEDYNLFGKNYATLNVLINNAPMAFDGNGETYVYSKTWYRALFYLQLVDAKWLWVGSSAVAKAPDLTTLQPWPTIICREKRTSSLETFDASPALFLVISEAPSTKKRALRIDNEPKAPSKVAGRLFCRPATVNVPSSPLQSPPSPPPAAHTALSSHCHHLS